MDIIKQVLEVLSAVGVEEVIFEPTDDDKTKIRGSNRDHNVIVFDVIDEKLTDHPMGVQSVKGLLSRIRLFDDSKAAISFREANGVINDIEVKQGRKKVSYRCASPTSVVAPKKVPGDMDETDRIVFPKEYTDYLSQAIASMSYTGDKKERTISLGVDNDGESATINIFDGEDDSFTDVISVDYRDTGKSYWEVVPFQRVMKQSVDRDYSGDQAARFLVTEHGVAVFDVDFLKIIVAPVG